MTRLELVIAAEAGVFFVALFALALYYRELAERRESQLRKLIARELMAAS